MNALLTYPRFYLRVLPDRPGRPALWVDDDGHPTENFADAAWWITKSGADDAGRELPFPSRVVNRERPKHNLN